MKTNTIIYFIASLVLVGAFFSCSKEINTDQEVKEIKLYLTDDPIDAEEVNVEILSVILIGEGKEEIELNTLSGVYNLLAFTGDIDTLIASGNYDLNKIKEIRLVLGENNSIKIDGVTYPLVIPSGMQSGIKIKINQDLNDKSLYNLLIDFDALASIYEEEGKYILSPVIRYKGDRNIKTIDKGVIVALLDCYEIQFPVTVRNTDEEDSEIDNLATLLQAYDDETIYGVKYPIQVVNVAGEEFKINNGNQAEKLIRICKGEDEEDDDIEVIRLAEALSKCYEIIFPIKVEGSDGNIFEVGSMEDLMTYAELEGFVFPFDAINPQGDTVPFNNYSQLEAKIKNCEKGEVEPVDVIGILDSIGACYNIEFPINIKMEGGEVIEIYSIDELLTGTNSPIAFVFPFKVSDGLNETITINNNNQIYKLFRNCDMDEDTIDVLSILTKLSACFEVAYPVTVETAEGMVLQVGSLEELMLLESKVVDIEFPFYIINKDGEKDPLNNLKQIEARLKNCKDMTEDNFEDVLSSLFKCYALTYPVILVGEDSMSFDANSYDEIIKIVEDNEIYSFSFPIEITDGDGKTKTVNNLSQLKGLLNNCKELDDDLIADIEKCYDLMYPINIINDDREVVKADDRDQLLEIWDKNDHPKFDFPISLIDENGNTIEIKNNGQLIRAIKDCGE